MKPAPFDCVRAGSVDEACRALADAGGGAVVLAGGQTLMPLMALRMSQPFMVIDITRIAALKGVSRIDGATRIGPLTRQNEGIADPVLNRHLPVVVEALRHVGHHQTRNRGTIGGSIAFGEPAAEMPTTALALGASIEARSVRGARTIAVEELYFGPYMTALEPDELVTAIDIPDWPEGTVTMFREVTRRPGDFALVGLVGALAIDRGRIERAGIGWFGMGPTPIKARRAEAALIGQAYDRLDTAAIADLAVADTEPFDDHHASADYRRSVGRRVFEKALREIACAREAA